MNTSDISNLARAIWLPVRCRAPLLALAMALCARNAMAAAVVDQTSVTGFISVGAGTWNTGPSPGYGINLHSDQPQQPTGGSYVTPWTPTGYDFAAPGSTHSVDAGIPDWDMATAKLQAQLAPAGSGANGLAISHLQLDLWVGDTQGYGKTSGGSFHATSWLTKPMPTGVFGALHWEVTAFPNSAGDSNTKIDLDLRLWEQAVLFSGPLANAHGDYAKGYPAMYAGSDIFVGELDSHIGASNSYTSPGGRFLVDVWWAFSDAPIDPTTLVRGQDPLPVPEPQTWTLVMGGLAMLGMLAPRRKSLWTELMPNFPGPVET